MAATCPSKPPHPPHTPFCNADSVQGTFCYSSPGPNTSASPYCFCQDYKLWESGALSTHHLSPMFLEQLHRSRHRTVLRVALAQLESQEFCRQHCPVASLSAQSTATLQLFRSPWSFLLFPKVLISSYNIHGQNQKQYAGLVHRNSHEPLTLF